MKNEKVQMEIMRAQGHDNKVSLKNNSFWARVDSPIGLTKAHIGVIFNLPILEDLEIDYLMFMLKDLVLTDYEDESFRYIFKLQYIPRADQNDIVVKINDLTGATLELHKDFI